MLFGVACARLALVAVYATATIRKLKRVMVGFYSAQRQPTGLSVHIFDGKIGHTVSV